MYVQARPLWRNKHYWVLYSTTIKYTESAYKATVSIEILNERVQKAKLPITFMYLRLFSASHNVTSHCTVVQYRKRILIFRAKANWHLRAKANWHLETQVNFAAFLFLQKSPYRKAVYSVRTAKKLTPVMSDSFLEILLTWTLTLEGSDVILCC